MKILQEKDIIKRIYPEVTRKRYLGSKKHCEIFDLACKNRESIKLLNLRVSID